MGSNGTGSRRKSEVRRSSNSTFSVSGSNSDTSDFIARSSSRSSDSANLLSIGGTRELAEPTIVVGASAVRNLHPVSVEGSGGARTDLNSVRRDSSGSTVTRRTPGEGHTVASSSGSDNNWARSSSRNRSALYGRRLTLGTAFASSSDLVASTSGSLGVALNSTEAIRLQTLNNSVPGTESVSCRTRLDQVAFGVRILAPLESVSTDGNIGSVRSNSSVKSSSVCLGLRNTGSTVVRSDSSHGNSFSSLETKLVD